MVIRGGGTNLIKKTDFWTSTSSLCKVSKTDKGMTFGDPSYSGSVYSDYTGYITSEPFEMATDKVLTIFGKSFLHSAGDKSYNEIYIVKENGTEQRLFSNTETDYTSFKSITITKNGFTGNLRLKFYFAIHGNWANYFTITRCNIT